MEQKHEYFRNTLLKSLSATIPENIRYALQIKNRNKIYTFNNTYSYRYKQPYLYVVPLNNENDIRILITHYTKLSYYEKFPNMSI